MSPKLKNYSQKDDGSGLIMALMTLMVFSILAASIGAITIGAYRLSSVNRDTTSAYYIAEAGVNQAYEEMKGIVLSAHEDSSITSKNDFINKIDSYITSEGEYFTTINSHQKESDNSNGFSTQFGEFTEAKVQLIEGIEEGNSKTYTLKSEGAVDNKKRVVEKEFDVTWVDRTESNQLPVIPANTSIITKNQIDFLGGTIFGDIFLDSGKKGGFELGQWGSINSNNIYYDPLINVSELYTAPSWRINNPDPDYTKILEKTRPINQPIPWNSYKELLNIITVPDYSEYRTLRNSRQELIDTNAYIPTMKLVGGNRTSINTNNTEINLVVNNLNVDQGFIDLKGSGTVNIFVLENFTIGGDSIINTDANSDQLNLFYMGDSSISLDGAQKLNGNLLIKKADVTYSGSGNINGATITGGKLVDIKGGSINNTLIIAPSDNSEIRISGSGTVRGALVTSYLNMTGGTVEHSLFDMSRLPLKTSELDSDSSTTEIISSEPVNEPR